MRILLGYHHYRDHRDVKTMVENRLARLRAKGMDIVPFVLTLNPPGPRLHWKELDARWRRGDRELLQMYETLGAVLEGFDVFINWNGINVHPEFVRQLSTFNVYGCNDDPESSENLSRPVAAAYDLCMIGNCAELDNYRSWGVRHVEFWPLGFLEDDWDPRLTSERILKAEREVDVTILCERLQQADIAIVRGGRIRQSSQIRTVLCINFLT